MKWAGSQTANESGRDSTGWGNWRRETCQRGRRERENQKETEREGELSDLGWKRGSRESGLAGFWWRSVVVQKSSSARRHCVRRGPWPWAASPPQSHGHKPPTPPFTTSTTTHPTPNPLAGSAPPKLLLHVYLIFWRNWNIFVGWHTYIHNYTSLTRARIHTHTDTDTHSQACMLAYIHTHYHRNI